MEVRMTQDPKQPGILLGWVFASQDVLVVVEKGIPLEVQEKSGELHQVDDLLFQEWIFLSSKNW